MVPVSAEAVGKCGNPEGIFQKECGEGGESGFMAFHGFHELCPFHALFFALVLVGNINSICRNQVHPPTAAFRHEVMGSIDSPPLYL